MSDVISTIEATAEIKSYTLVGDDIYVKRYTNENIPTWYRNLVSDIIAADNTVLDQASAIAYLESLAPGYNISITSLQNKDLQIDTSIESLVTKDGDKTAAIGQLNLTKVDATSAAAIAQNTIGAYFAGSESAAWFNSKISTYASNIASNASSINTLSASLNGQEVRIDSVEQVAIDASSWSAVASKLITSPDGSITWWSFANGTGIQSNFKIHANNFSVSDGTTGYTPFSIVGSNVSFNGVVDFTNTNTYGTTTIDGGKITTGSITAGQISTTAISSKTIVGGTIDGAYISGVTITGAIIKASYIDLSNQNYLTNWAVITDINTILSQYWPNFARDVNNVPIKDASGYYRLITTNPLAIGTKNDTVLGMYSSYAAPFYTYDYYQVLAQKPISSSFTLLPYNDYGWTKLSYGKVWNSNNASEYFGGKLSQSIRIAGYEFRIDGYMERHHYSDPVYNTVFLKLYQDGSLIDFANATGSASNEGIPYCGTQPYAAGIERIVTIGTMQVRIRMVAANMTVSNVAWYTTFMASVGITTGTYPLPSYVAYTIEVYTPYPGGSVCTPKPGYSGPMLTYTHNYYTFTGSYADNSYQPSMNILHNNYKIEQA